MEVNVMTEYIVIGLVIIALTIAYIITAKTAKNVSVLLSKATKEVMEIVSDIRQANAELQALREELNIEYKKTDRLPENRRHDERREHDRRECDRRVAEDAVDPKPDISQRPENK